MREDDSYYSGIYKGYCFFFFKVIRWILKQFGQLSVELQDRVVEMQFLVGSCVLRRFFSKSFSSGFFIQVVGKMDEEDILVYQISRGRYRAFEIWDLGNIGKQFLYVVCWINIFYRMFFVGLFFIMRVLFVIGVLGKYRQIDFCFFGSFVDGNILVIVYEIKEKYGSVYSYYIYLKGI